jgi:hypothetical protein
MGVRGLASYVRDAGSLGKPVSFDGAQVSRAVVDGWALAFYLYPSDVCGGDYREFADIVRAQCEAWRRLGLAITVIWDGTCTAFTGMGTDFSP